MAEAEGKFAGKIYVVTGGTQGIGRAVALALAEAGAGGGAAVPLPSRGSLAMIGRGGRRLRTDRLHRRRRVVAMGRAARLFPGRRAQPVALEWLWASFTFRRGTGLITWQERG